MKNTVLSLLLIPAIAFLSGCQSARQDYQIVSVSSILLTADEKFHPFLTGYDKLRKVSLANWQCYVPDDKPDETFFCADRGAIAVFISGKQMPSPQNSNNPGSSEEHTHHD